MQREKKRRKITVKQEDREERDEDGQDEEKKMKNKENENIWDDKENKEENKWWQENSDKEEGKIGSRREYREFLANGSIKINGSQIEDENLKLTNEFLLDKVVFLSLGKKNKYLVWK